LFAFGWDVSLEALSSSEEGKQRGEACFSNKALSLPVIGIADWDGKDESSCWRREDGACLWVLHVGHKDGSEKTEKHSENQVDGNGEVDKTHALYNT